MKDQLTESIDMFGEVLPNTVTSPAAKHIFEMNDNVMHLEKHRSYVHYLTEDLIYVTKR